jgi:hypothetical protein
MLSNPLKSIEFFMESLQSDVKSFHTAALQSCHHLDPPERLAGVLYTDLLIT